MVVTPLLGTHWSNLPAFHTACAFVPAVRRVWQEGFAQVAHLGPEGEQICRAVRLVPDALARRQGHRVRVREAADAPQRAEVMVEGSVLLHEEDDVLDVVDRARPAMGGDGERLAESLRERGRCGRCAQQRQECTTANIAQIDAPAYAGA